MTPYNTKTMRVNLADGTYQDVVFTGDIRTLPVLTSLPGLRVRGLVAPEISTRPGRPRLGAAILRADSRRFPAARQRTHMRRSWPNSTTLSRLPGGYAAAVEDWLPTEHPAASASMRVEGGYIQFSGDGKKSGKT